VGTPQIILIVLVAIAGTITLMNHGKPRPDYSFPAWILGAGIELGLLYWGGFFG
jgi:choline-glycine betaine transporter